MPRFDVEPESCPTCAAFVREGTTTVTMDAPWGVIVVRDVPAFICPVCGEAWLDDAVSQAVEVMAERGADRNALLSVFSFNDPID